MIRPLRTYHFFIWRVIAPVLAILFVMAIRWRPDSKRDNSSANSFVVSSTAVSESETLITIDVLNPLTTPTCVVIAEREKGSTMLGDLDGVSRYTFLVKGAVQRIVLLDKIHDKEILRKDLTKQSR